MEQLEICQLASFVNQTMKVEFGGQAILNV